MLKQLLIGSSTLTLPFASSLPTQAQIQPNMSQMLTVSQAQVSAEELQKFASAMRKVQVIQQNSQMETIRVIQREGLSPERFKQIYQMQRNPQARRAATVTQQERQRFELAVTKVNKIQNQTQSVMLRAIQDTGLRVQRFNQILAALRQNPKLQQQVQRLRS